MAFPHPKSCQDNNRKGNKPNNWRVIREFFERTINVTGYRDGKDNVDPAENRAFGAVIHNRFVNLQAREITAPAALPSSVFPPSTGDFTRHKTFIASRANLRGF